MLFALNQNFKTRISSIICLLSVAVCVVIATTEINAADTKYRFDSWTTDNGLPQVSVNSIIQTRDGFLWITTFGGLVRYDGLRFQVFNTGNTKGMHSGRFVQLKEDREGALWISTESQGVTRYKDGVFTSFTAGKGLPENTIKWLDLDASGALIVETENYIMQWDGNKFITAQHAPNEPASRPLFRTSSGGKWFFNNGRVQKYQNGVLTIDVPTDLDVARGYEDRKGNFWIAAGQKDLIIKLENGKITEYTARDGYPEFRISNIIEDNLNQTWLSDLNGMHIFDGKKFTLLTSDDGLVRGTVNTLFQDREGTIWVGTSGGLSRLTRRAITAYSKEDGLGGDNVYPVYQDRAGKIYVGSWSGLSVFQNGAFSLVPGFETEPMTTMLEDSRGGMWYGTFAGVRPPAGWNRALPPSVATDHIRSIYEDREGNLWFGTVMGLVKYNGREFTSFTQENGSLPRSFYVIHQDRQGTMWFGTEAGIVTLRDGKFTSISETHGLSATIVRSIYEDNDGTLWIGMYDSGIYRYKDGIYTHYTTEHGLFDNGAFKIIEDDSGNFWISCNLGIYRVRKSELDEVAAGNLKEVTSVVYNKRDGMLNSECNGGGQNAGIRATDGKIWFPTQQGVAVIDPTTIPINSQPPPVVIESLVIDGAPVPVKASISLDPGQTNLELHYAGLSFINPELVKFKYRLEGLDENWIDAGTRRTAYYPHLPPGEYKFAVIAANRDGIWNEQGSTITINVLPPFWRTWWFVTLVAMSLTALIFLAYRFRVGQLKRAHDAKEAFARQLIESQESERKRIAAELHDSLGQSLVLIKNWALLGLGGLTGKEPAKAHLEEISSTATEAIREVREISYNLGPYQLERLGLANTIREMIQKVEASSSVKFKTSIGDIDGCLEREAEISLFRIVQEVASNIVRHSGATEAALDLSISQNVLTLFIRDNGKGFDPETNRTGFGLLGMNERVGLLHGELLVRSEIGKGSSIKVTLPCKDPS